MLNFDLICPKAPHLWLYFDFLSSLLANLSHALSTGDLLLDQDTMLGQAPTQEAFVQSEWRGGFSIVSEHARGNPKFCNSIPSIPFILIHLPFICWLVANFFSPPSCCTHKLPNRRYLSKSTLLKRSCQIDLTSVRKLPKIEKVRPSYKSMQCKTGKTARLCASHYWTAENWSHKFQTLQLFVSNI